MGVLFVYRTKSTGLAPPVFILRRIVFVLFIYIVFVLFIYKERKQTQCDESKD